VDAPILALRNLHVRFRTGDGILHAVRGVDLDVGAGETVAVVGESGSGKSQTMMAAMGLLASNGWAEGSARYRGAELIGLRAAALNRYRGAKLTMIFQEPMTSLDPLYSIGDQLALPLSFVADWGGGKPAIAPSNSSISCASPIQPDACRPTRTSSRAGSASA
jgi:oligopeptide transport system ATP-binding protein